MAFSDFKSLADVQKKYQIRYTEAHYLNSLERVPSATFMADFQFNQEHIDVFSSEASRSEVIISPLLREVYKHHHQGYSFWIQKNLRYDDILNGTPDYLFSHRSTLGKTVLEPPFVVIVEAKRNDFDQGWAQCLAELVAAQKLNTQPERPIHGIVTDGNLWQFGQLVNDTFMREPRNFTIDRLPELYGVLDTLLKQMAPDTAIDD